MGNAADGADGGMISLMAEVPEPLLLAMRRFIEQHPNWDQYRLFQAALAGFLVQHAPGDRTITRCYLANLFPGSGGFQSPPLAGRAVGSSERPGGRPPERSGERPRLRALPRPVTSSAVPAPSAANPSAQAA